MLMKNRLTKVKQNNLSRRKRKTKKQASNNNSSLGPDHLGRYNLSVFQKLAVFGFALGSILLILIFNPDANYSRLNQESSAIETFWKIKSPLSKIYYHPKAACLSLDLKRINKQNEFHNRIYSIVKNTNMEVMTDEISRKNPKVAGFLVGIAMKESKFGTYAPKKNGRDCFNYWGYRGPENTTKSGYSCFDSPEHAVSVVSRRIEKIVNQGATTPASMIVWKCGSTCAGHSEESVNKWIADVGINYYKINSKVEVAKLL